MASAKLDTITHEEFEERLDRNNMRLRQELAEAQERVQALERLIARKENFVQHLTQVLTDIEREESEIAALEKGLRAPRATTRRHRQSPQAPL
jgi:hypothetical protein